MSEADIDRRSPSDRYRRYLERQFGANRAGFERYCELLQFLTPTRLTRPEPRIFALATVHESNEPVGGLKVLYRHVDILNRNGLTASVIHRTPGFRHTWFENHTSISYLSGPGLLCASDILIVPEVFGPFLGEIAPGVRKVIYNQNCYYTFMGYSFDTPVLDPAYTSHDVLATVVVSQDSLEYLRYGFAGAALHRVHLSVDPSLFYPAWPKRREVGFMPRKRPNELIQVLTLLRLRGALDGFRLRPIHNVSEAEVARTMRECLIYVSTSSAEGFGLPPAEAMACGCVVVGFHGGGGKEYFDPSFAYPVEEGDIRGFAATIEEVIDTERHRPGVLRDKGRQASEFIRKRYSPENEERDVIETWKAILNTARSDDEMAAAGGPV
jgi:hypothetical protein